MKNYTVAWGEDTMPGRGVIAFDTETHDIEIVGFMNNRQKVERLESELSQQMNVRDNLRIKAKEMTQLINETKGRIKQHL